MFIASVVEQFLKFEHATGVMRSDAATLAKCDNYENLISEGRSR